jgi:hypothetical protein
MNWNGRSIGRMLAGIAVALVLSGCTSLLEQDSLSPSVEVLTAKASFEEASKTSGLAAPRRYFIEFRGEFYSYPGHAYFIYGELKEDGTIAKKYGPVGFNARFGPVGAIIGTVAAPGTFEPYPWDDKLAPMASYHVELNPQQYADLLAFIERTTKEKRYWNAFSQNCTSYVADAARTVGLRTPGGLPYMFPPLFINKIKQLNST